MIIASGITDGSVFVMFAIFFTIVAIAHYFLFKVIYIKVFCDSLAKVRGKNKLLQVACHAALFFLSCLIVYGLLAVRYYFT